jgi:nucleoside 2-deoxyribosyltransferase
MPVASDPEYQSKRSVIESVATAFGLATLFPLDAGTEFNLDVTLTELRESDIIIADLSNERPSCYYELGLVHALHKPVFVFATVGTIIHQLSDRKSVAFYDGLAALRDLLTHAIASTKLANKEMYGSCGSRVS